MSRILRDAAKKAPIFIVSVEGGKKDNAIPRECLSEIIVEADKAEAVKAAVEETANEIREEFATSDADFNVTTELSDGCSVLKLLQRKTVPKRLHLYSHFLTE